MSFIFINHNSIASTIFSLLSFEFQSWLMTSSTLLFIFISFTYFPNLFILFIKIILLPPKAIGLPVLYLYQYFATDCEKSTWILLSSIKAFSILKYASSHAACVSNSIKEYCNDAPVFQSRITSQLHCLGKYYQNWITFWLDRIVRKLFPSHLLEWLDLIYKRKEHYQGAWFQHLVNH